MSKDREPDRNRRVMKFRFQIFGVCISFCISVKTGRFVGKREHTANTGVRTSRNLTVVRASMIVFLLACATFLMAQTSGMFFDSIRLINLYL